MITDEEKTTLKTEGFNELKKGAAASCFSEVQQQKKNKMGEAQPA